MAFASVITPDQSRIAGEQIWELILTNWGNLGALADPSSLAYGKPPVGVTIPVAFTSLLRDLRLPPVVALAIAPDSFVDTCVFNSFPPFIPGVQAGLTFYERFVSQDRPWLGQLTSPIIIQNISFNDFPAQQFVRTARTFADTYLPAGATATQTFGTALDGGNESIFIKPRLNLLFYIGNPPASIQHRSVFVDRFVAVQNNVNTTEIIRVFPVMGRKTVRLLVSKIVGAGATTVTPSRVDNIGAAPLTGLPVLKEDPLAAGVALNAGQQTTFVFQSQQITFLVLKANSANAGASIAWGLEAVD